MNWLYWCGWSLSRSLATVLLGYKATGRDNVPLREAIIIAANHQSYLDPPLVGAGIRREWHFFAKKELFDIFPLGWIISRVNAIPVRRGMYDPASLSRAFDVLAHGGGLVLFPEGTRGNGSEFLKPKPGVGMIARRARVAIVPTYAMRTNRLWAALLARKRIAIYYGRPIPVEQVEQYSDDKEGYQALAELVMEKIAGLKAAAWAAAAG